MGNSSRIERLTAQFYEWELPGRGWYIYDTPVDLEPIFVPFFFHQVPTEVVDDGKHHSILSYVAESVRNAVVPKKEPQFELPEPEPPQAYQFLSDDTLCGFSISLPEGEKLKTDEIVQFLVMLSSTWNADFHYYHDAK